MSRKIIFDMIKIKEFIEGLDLYWRRSLGELDDGFSKKIKANDQGSCWYLLHKYPSTNDRLKDYVKLSFNESQEQLNGLLWIVYYLASSMILMMVFSTSFAMVFNSLASFKTDNSFVGSSVPILI